LCNVASCWFCLNTLMRYGPMNVKKKTCACVCIINPKVTLYITYIVQRVYWRRRKTWRYL